MLEGRWTIFVCTACGEATGRHKACDAKREATPVVPVDDAAVERAARAALVEMQRIGDAEDLDPERQGDESPEEFVARSVATAVLRAAGEQS